MKPRIVGVVMVKNEDVWISQVLERIVPFCDYIRFIDTGSVDDTVGEARRTLRGAMASFDIISEPRLKQTHAQVEAYVGTNTWVFGVDGDELYDPSGLAVIREKIRSSYGGFAYQVKGMYLHADLIRISHTNGRTNRTAVGWFGPPSHNPTKLYNFANITAWPNDWEHTLFHAKTRVVRKGSTVLHATTPWSNARLRCVHLRWIQRSTNTRNETARLTPEDIAGFGSRRDRGGSNQRNERLSYQQGERHAVDMETFEEVPWPTD